MKSNTVTRTRRFSFNRKRIIREYYSRYKSYRNDGMTDFFADATATTDLVKKYGENKVQATLKY